MSALVDEDTITHGQIWAIAARAAEQKNADLLARCANALRGARGSRRYKFGIRACVVAHNANVLLTQVAEQQEHEDADRQRQAAWAQRRLDRRAKVGAP